MLKRLQKYDYFFIIAILAGLLMHLSCIYGVEHYADETFFPTIPLRLINGDSLVQHEWHLTQFSSLFLYVPVRFWLAIKGSTEGILLFLRYFYLIIHTLTSVGLYTYFRKHKAWAIAASLLFYTQVPLRFMNANYHSLLALFLLLFTITLLTIYKKNNLPLYLFAGFCYGCGCVCNPFTCALFVIYIIICVIWNKKKTKHLSEEDTLQTTQKREICNRFFSWQAFLKFFIGLVIAASVSIAFFFATDGTISSLLENIENLLNESRHNLLANPVEEFLSKFQITISVFNKISFELPFLLPALYGALLFDKNRRKTNHKIVYISISLALAIFYCIGVTVCSLKSMYALAVSLPLVIVSTVCYILTENKNKKLFYCMWLPGLIATIIQYFASALHFSVFWVMTISNIAGIFFIKNFLEETLPKKELHTKKKSEKSLYTIFQSMLCIAICLQLIFQCFVYTLGRTVKIDEYTQLNKGPYAGFYLNDNNYNQHLSMINDLDIIKERSNPDDHVLIISEFSWMYLYIDRPFATYSAWQPYLQIERLISYFENNPDKKPKYIYVGWIYISANLSIDFITNPQNAQKDAETIKKLFDCTQEDLANGILLTVK